MYKWEKPNLRERNKHEYDPKTKTKKTPTFSSSLLDQISKSTKIHDKQHELSFRETYCTKNRGIKTEEEEEKMVSLQKACLMEKWMEKKVNEKAISRGKNQNQKQNQNQRSSTTLLDEFDVQDALFFSTTSSSSDSSLAELESSVFSNPNPNPKPRVLCFAPPRPKPVRTQPIESKFLEQLDRSKNEEKSRSRALKIYSNLKNLKQPISPGVRLTSFINSLFVKEGGKSKKINGFFPKECKSEQSSTCSSASSFTRSCLSKKNTSSIKRTVKFFPVSVIVDEDSRPCGHKSLYEEDYDNGGGNRISSSKFARSLSKRYEELRKLNGLEKENARFQHQKLEEVALDLLNGYWDSKLSKSHSLNPKDQTNYDDCGGNHAGNYGCHQGDDDDDDDDVLSCSSSDLFELDHLSLIGNDLPVYETTQFDPKFL